MQIFIKIQNKGEIDPLAFKLIGASTKREDESKIGFFGSGNKYALSVLLRNNIYFKIFSGKKEIVFDKKAVSFRDRSYEMITINGENTSMTTDMGPDWEEWFIIREFYCNAMDEGEATISVTDTIEPEDGTTTIYIEKTESLGTFFSNFERYMLAESHKKYLEVIYPDYYKCGGIATLKAFDDEFIAYRKGIRINTKNHSKSLYRYNFEKIDINESRIVKNEHDMRQKIAYYFASTEKKDVILNYLNNWKGKFEQDAAWWWINDLSPTWHEILEGKRVYPDDKAMLMGDGEIKSQSFIVPKDLAEKIAKFIPKCTVVGISDGGKYDKVDELKEDREKLEKAVKTLKSYGYEITVPIGFANFYDNQVQACYSRKNREIIFSLKDFRKLDDDEIVRTLLEEFFHTLGHEDSTRSFEDFLMRQIIKLKKESLNQ